MNRLLYFIKKNTLNRHQFPGFLRSQGMNIGEDCDIYKNVDFGSEPYLIEIGNHVRINAGVCFVTHDGGLWVLRDERSGYGKEFADADCFGKIVVCDNVHIGSNAIIMPGVTIGENSIIACGAVVTHNVEANSIVGGVPARAIETLQEYAEKMRQKCVNTHSMSEEEKKQFLNGHIH